MLCCVNLCVSFDVVDVWYYYVEQDDVIVWCCFVGVVFEVEYFECFVGGWDDGDFFEFVGGKDELQCVGGGEIVIYYEDVGGVVYEFGFFCGVWFYMCQLL